MVQKTLTIIMLYCLCLPIFATEDLRQVYDTALQSDPLLKSEQANAHAATAVKNQSTGALLPSLSLTADWNNQSIDVIKGINIQNIQENTNTNSLRLLLQQPIFRLDLWELRKQGAIGEKIKFADLENAKQDLIMRVSRRYFLVLAAADNLDFAQAEKKAVGRQLEQVKKRFEVGLIAITDVQESKARYDLTVAQQIEAENQLSLSIESLREVTGQYYEKIKALSEKMPLAKPIPEQSGEWKKIALGKSPLVEIARLNLKLAHSEVKLGRSGHFPSVDLTGSYAHNEDDGNPNFQEIERTSIGVTVALSLYQGGQVNARTRESQQKFIAAQEILEQQTRSTKRETRAAYLNVVAAISRVKALKQALKSTKTALRATQAGFEVGTRTSVDILDAQRELFRAQRDYAQTRYDYIINLMLLKKAAGTLDVKDIDLVNSWLD